MIPLQAQRLRLPTDGCSASGFDSTSVSNVSFEVQQFLDGIFVFWRRALYVKYFGPRGVLVSALGSSRFRVSRLGFILNSMLSRTFDNRRSTDLSEVA